MVLAVFYGSGSGAESVYKRRQEFPPDTVTVAFEEAGDWIPPEADRYARVHPLDIEGIRRVIKSYGITETCFIGLIWRSFSWRQIARYPRLAVYSAAVLWFHRKLPHGLLLTMEAFLREDVGVSTRSVREYLADITGAPGTAIGQLPKFDVQRILLDARRSANDTEQQNVFWVTQSFIYEVNVQTGAYSQVAREAFGTNRLIRRVAALRQRRTSDSVEYVFVKVSIDAFDKLDTASIGITTVAECVNAGIRTAILESNSVLVFQRDEITRFCEENDFSIVFPNIIHASRV